MKRYQSQRCATAADAQFISALVAELKCKDISAFRFGEKLGLYWSGSYPPVTCWNVRAALALTRRYLYAAITYGDFPEAVRHARVVVRLAKAIRQDGELKDAA